MSGNRYSKVDTQHIAEGRFAEVARARAAFHDTGSGDLPTFVRMIVLDVISDPTTLDKIKLSYYEHELHVSNIGYASVAPRNSIIARRVLAPGVSAAEKIMVLYPFFPPHLAMPAKPGEHVWAMFEHPGAKSNDLGYWLCRIVQPNFVEDVNYTHADRQFDPSFSPGLTDAFEGTNEPKYEFRNGAVDEKDGSRYAIPQTASIPRDEKAYEKLLQESDASKIIKYESVPRFRKRPADIALEGSNNSLIVLGTDRLGPISDYDTNPQSGQIPKPLADDASGSSGVIDLVAGRGQTSDTGGKEVENTLIGGGTLNKELGKSKKELATHEGDVDYKHDRSRVIIQQRVHVDERFELTNYNTGKDIGANVKDSERGDGAIVIKTDKVRIIARSDVQLLVEGAIERDENGNLKPGTVQSKWASVTLKSNGDIVIVPAEKGLLKLGGDDADLAPLCTRVNNKGEGGKVTASPIVDTMAGAQGGHDGMNGTFPQKILMK